MPARPRLGWRRGQRSSLLELEVAEEHEHGGQSGTREGRRDVPDVAARERTKNEDNMVVGDCMRTVWNERRGLGVRRRRVGWLDAVGAGGERMEPGGAVGGGR